MDTIKNGCRGGGWKGIDAEKKYDSSYSLRISASISSDYYKPESKGRKMKSFGEGES